MELIELEISLKRILNIFILISEVNNLNMNSYQRMLILEKNNSISTFENWKSRKLISILTDKYVFVELC